jgi:hypothetical protein
MENYSIRDVLSLFPEESEFLIVEHADKRSRYERWEMGDDILNLPVDSCEINQSSGEYDTDLHYIVIYTR